MPFMTKLEATKREGKGNLGSLRASGSIPAVFYGPKEESTSITLHYNEFEKVLRQAGESTVITLVCDGKEHDVLVHDVSRDPISNRISHVDFYVIEKGKKVRVHVPVEFTGVSPAVKERAGILVKVMHEVEIEAMPKDLPHSLVADISTLVTFEDHVTAKDIKLPSGVTLITDAEEIIALANLPKEETEEASAPIDLSKIEVEKKGKEVREGEEGESKE